MSDLIRPDVARYAEEHTTPAPEALRLLAEETAAELGREGMLSGPVVGRLLEMLVHALAPQLVLEIGTFSGYSALCMAAALPPGGRIVTCEISERHAALARRHIAGSPHAERIEVRVGDAMQTIAELERPLDFVYIDADKPGYPAYFEAVIDRLSPRGLVALDNMLLDGEVLDPHSEAGHALANLGERLAGDERLSACLLTVRDGVTLVRRR